MESFEIMTVEKDGEYISGSDNVTNEEVLRRVEEERNIPTYNTTKEGYLDWSQLE